MRPTTLRRLLPLALLASGLTTAGAVAAPAAGSGASSGPTVTTTVSDVRAARLADGTPGLLAYSARHDATGPAGPTGGLPGAEIRRADHPAAFAGAFGSDDGDLAAWLSPAASTGFQLAPTSRLVENAYFGDRFAAQAQPLAAGDSAEVAMADVVGNAPLPWRTARGTADGALAWDLASVSRPLRARYGPSQGEVDVVLVRADLVARGGDVDARREAVESPPLTIPLPRTYPTDVTPLALAAVAFPYTAYVGGLKLDVVPTAGTAVLRVSAKGWLPEARERVLPGGGRVAEWHLPVVAAIVLDPGLPGPDPVAGPGPDPVAAAGVRLTQGGLAHVVLGNRVADAAVPAGGTVTATPARAAVFDAAGNALDLRVQAAARGAETAQSASAADDPSAVPLPPTATDELLEAERVDATLARPVTLRTGNGSLRLTLDPNSRGEGVLAVRDVTRLAPDRPVVGEAAVPLVVVDGAPIRLTRDLLVDLRVLPRTDLGTAQFTGESPYGGGVNRDRAVSLTPPSAGAEVRAVYALAGGRRAFVTWAMEAQRGLLSVRATVVALDGTAVQATPVLHVEPAATGPVAADGVEQQAEFSAPLGGTAAVTVATATGPLRVTGTGGTATVLRAPAAYTATPSPAGRALAGAPVAVVLPTPNGASLSVEAAPAADVPATPPPLGVPCRGVPVSDPDGDATTALDLRRAWIDADAGSVLATVQVAELPTAAPAGTTYSVDVRWRHEHTTRYARAVLDDAGRWSFDAGGWNGQYFRLLTTTGETRPGAGGVVRIAVPRELLLVQDGDVLRDTSAHSARSGGVAVPGGVAVAGGDRAPDGTPPDHGTGGEVVVAAC